MSQIILQANYSRLQPTYTDGPADICIEVVSLESIKRHHGENFAECELSGVGEYCILDPLRDEPLPGYGAIWEMTKSILGQ